MLSLLNWHQEGGGRMEYIATLFLAVTAQVVGHYVCKWLDRHKSDN